MIYSICIELIKCSVLIIILHYLFLHIKQLFTQVCQVDTPEVPLLFNKRSISKEPIIEKDLNLVEELPEPTENGTTDITFIHNELIETTPYDKPLVTMDENKHSEPDQSIKRELLDFINNEFIVQKTHQEDSVCSE